MGDYKQCSKRLEQHKMLPQGSTLRYHCYKALVEGLLSSPGPRSEVEA